MSPFDIVPETNPHGWAAPLLTSGRLCNLVVAPIEPVREMCEGYDVELLEVDDNHRLHDSLDLMVEATRKITNSR